MRRKKQSQSKKPIFAHDENLEFTLLRKRSNKYAMFIPLIKIAHKRGLKDPKVIELCNKKNVHILTHNTTDFQHPGDKVSIGIVCVGARIDEKWVKLFNKLLNKFPSHQDLFNLNILINDRLLIRDRKTKKEFFID